MKADTDLRLVEDSSVYPSFQGTGGGMSFRSSGPRAAETIYNYIKGWRNGGQFNVTVNVRPVRIGKSTIPTNSVPIPYLLSLRVCLLTLSTLIDIVKLISRGC